MSTFIDPAKAVLFNGHGRDAVVDGPVLEINLNPYRVSFCGYTVPDKLSLTLCEAGLPTKDVPCVWTQS